MGEAINEFLYASYRRNLRRNQHLKPGKARNLHHLERAFYFWPMWLYIYLQGRRRPHTIEAPKGAFFMPENNKEDT